MLYERGGEGHGLDVDIHPQTTDPTPLPRSLSWSPVRDVSRERTAPSPLQLAPGTVLLLDETVMAPGQLSSQGVVSMQVGNSGAVRGGTGVQQRRTPGLGLGLRASGKRSCNTFAAPAPAPCALPACPALPAVASYQALHCPKTTLYAPRTPLRPHHPSALPFLTCLTYPQALMTLARQQELLYDFETFQHPVPLDLPLIVLTQGRCGTRTSCVPGLPAQSWGNGGVGRSRGAMAWRFGCSMAVSSCRGVSLWLLGGKLRGVGCWPVTQHHLQGSTVPRWLHHADRALAPPPILCRSLLRDCLPLRLPLTATQPFPSAEAVLASGGRPPAAASPATSPPSSFGGAAIEPAATPVATANVSMGDGAATASAAAAADVDLAAVRSYLAAARAEQGYELAEGMAQVLEQWFVGQRRAAQAHQQGQGPQQGQGGAADGGMTPEEFHLKLTVRG